MRVRQKFVLKWKKLSKVGMFLQFPRFAFDDVLRGKRRNDATCRDSDCRETDEERGTD